jgi:hypothetical protein
MRIRREGGASMPRGSHFVAAIALVAAMFAHAQPAKRDAPASGDARGKQGAVTNIYIASAPESSQTSTSSAIGSSVAQPVYYRAVTDEEERANSANESKYIALTGVFTGILALFTALLAGLAFKQGKDLKLSISTATQALEVSKNTQSAYASVERAWLFISTVDATYMNAVNAEGDAIEPIMRVYGKWTNSGRSPGIKSVIYQDHRYVPGLAQNEAPPLFEHEIPQIEMHANVLPGVPFPGMPIVISKAEVDAVVGGEARLFFYFRAEYSTIFDSDSNARHVTECCMEFVFGGEINNGAPIFIKRPIGPQNTVS